MNDLKIFSGLANQPLAQDICRYLNLPMGKITLGRFPDGEISCKIEGSAIALKACFVKKA